MIYKNEKYKRRRRTKTTLKRRKPHYKTLLLSAWNQGVFIG